MPHATILIAPLWLSWSWFPLLLERKFKLPCPRAVELSPPVGDNSLAVMTASVECLLL